MPYKTRFYEYVKMIQKCISVVGIGPTVITAATLWLIVGSVVPASPSFNSSAAADNARLTPKTRNPVNTTETCWATNIDWRQYVAPRREFSLQYPGTTHPDISQEKKSGLLLQAMFKFNQPFDAGAGNKGSIRFDFQVSVWQNPERLSAEAWARRDIDPTLISDAGARTVANAEGYSLRKSDLASWTVEIFAARADRIYEISYLDIVTDDSLLSDRTKACWKTVLDKMVDSFTLLQATTGFPAVRQDVQAGRGRLPPDPAKTGISDSETRDIDKFRRDSAALRQKTKTQQRRKGRQQSQTTHQAYFVSAMQPQARLFGATVF